MIEREWFKHDYLARSDLKIEALRSKFGMRGYGIYWALVEFAYEHNGVIRVESPLDIVGLEAHLRESGLQEVLDYMDEVGLLIRSPDGYSCTRIIEQLEARREKSEVYSANAKQRKAIAQQTPAIAEQTSTEGEGERELEKEYNSRGGGNSSARATPRLVEIQGIEGIRVDAEALAKFEKDFPNGEMRRFYLNKFATWARRKKIQLDYCPLQEIRTWISEDKFEKKRWFAVRAGASPPLQQKVPPINQDGEKILKSLNVKNLVKGMT